MKKLFLLPLILVSTLCLSQQTQVDYHGQLYIKGSKIFNQNNDTVSFAGLSFFWSNSDWKGKKFYNEDVVQSLVQDWNVSIVRTPLGIEASTGYIDDSVTNLQTIETVIQAAIDEGIYVIVDWHSHDATDYKQKAINFFSYIAKKYGEYPNIIYEIYNEPLQVSWSNHIKPYSEDVIQSIREFDSNNIIIVGTPSWSQRVQDVANDPITQYGNIAYGLHFYAGSHGASLRSNAKTAISKGVCVFVSEWGTVNADGTGSVATTEVESWLEFMKENHLSHCNWSICDKDEGASILKPNSSTSGDWSYNSDLTESGKYIYDMLQNWEGNDTTTYEVIDTTATKPITTEISNNILLSNKELLGAYVDIYSMQGQRLQSLIWSENSKEELQQTLSGIYILIITINRKKYSLKVQL